MKPNLNVDSDFDLNYKRDESILILPHNTLRFPDVMVVIESIIQKTKKYPDFAVTLYKVLNRKEKDLTKCGISEELINKFNNEWATYWEIAPRSNLYNYIDIVSRQKFTNKVKVLFHDKNAIDDVFEYDYYDGSIEALEDYIKNEQITTLVLDDIELLKELSDRQRISLQNMSFIISRVGYNYEMDSQLKTLMPKKILYDAQFKSFIEVGMIALFDFSQETIDKIKGGQNNA